METHNRERRHKTTISIPEELHRRAKAKAVLEGKSFSQVMRELLTEWVESPPKERSEGDKS